MKFIRAGQWRIEKTGRGVLAFVTNHGFLDNVTFRGMRQSLMQTFTDIYVLDLHGNSKKKEKAPDGGVDKNVFDIQQGVAIGIFVKEPGKEGPARVHHAEMWGPREGEGGKYDRLVEQGVKTTQWQELEPDSPYYFFDPRNPELMSEYQCGWKVTEMMLVNVLGFQSHRDQFAIDLDQSRLRNRISELREPLLTDDELRQRYELKDSRSWRLSEARKQLQDDGEWAEHFVRCAYRPFDWRWSYYSTVAMDRPRKELLGHVVRKDNLCLNTIRQTKMDSWQHAIVSDAPAPAVFVEVKDGSSVFPLYLYPQDDNLLDTAVEGRRPNLSQEFLDDLSEKLDLRFVPDGQGDLSETFGPEDVFNYAYAVFHSPTFRERYAEFLEIDFPRLPLTSDRALFSSLAQKGAELVGLHLMRSATLNNSAISFPVDGDHMVEKTDFKETTGRVYINDKQYFEGIPKETWEFQVGGYQVLEKWLKDRKGRTLSTGDIIHYRKVVTALSETRRIMQEIDRLIPEWPIR